MYSAPIILPLDWTGRIYVLEDEKGQVVGTGSREVSVASLTAAWYACFTAFDFGARAR